MAVFLSSLLAMASNAIRITLKNGCLFVIFDPTYSGMTILVAQALCLIVIKIYILSQVDLTGQQRPGMLGNNGKRQAIFQFHLIAKWIFDV